MAGLTYTIEFELVTTAHDRKLLNTKIKVAKTIYNTCLGEALKRLRAVLADKEYHTLVFGEKVKGYRKRVREIERQHNYSEYDLHAWASKCKHHFEGHLGINEVQKLATRAFHAVEKLHYRQAKKVHFKRFFDDMSIENKSNNTGVRFKDGLVLWGELRLPIIVGERDAYAHAALMDKTKYVRILRREIRGRERFYVQLIQAGLPPVKTNSNGEPRHLPNDGKLGIDIGPSTVAVVGKNHVCMKELAEGIQADHAKLRRLERAMDRSKRATNPDNYNRNGVPKKRCKWNYSNRYKKLRSERKELHRRMTALRKQSHESLANEVLSHGSDIRVETMRFQSLQKKTKGTSRNKKNGKINKKKRFGKSIAKHAPAMFLTILKRKLGYWDLALKEIDTYAVKASQFNHITGAYTKKQLSERWNDIDGIPIQRDLYSAFLIQNTGNDLNSVDINRCNEQWDEFVTLHDREVERLRQSSNKTLRWFAA
jgi:hypothetical protein